MKFLDELGVGVLLRRIALAVERSAAADEAQARVAEERWAAEQAALSPRIARKTEFGTMDVAAANERWRKEREAEMADE